MDILVIGDKGHPRAICVDWLDEFPNIEEFDLVIMALSTLTEANLDRIPSDKLRAIREEIRTLFKTGRAVWCIIGRQFTQSIPNSAREILASRETPPTNYDWLFVPVEITDVKEGQSVQTKDRGFEPYLEKVKRWNLEIKPLYIPNKTSLSYMALTEMNADLDLRLVPLATNKSQKMIAAKLTSESHHGSICFLPKATECNVHAAIGILIDIYASLAKANSNETLPTQGKTAKEHS